MAFLIYTLQQLQNVAFLTMWPLILFTEQTEYEQSRKFKYEDQARDS